MLYGGWALQSQFTWLDRTGRPLGLIGEPVEHQGQFRLSPDKRRIAEVRESGEIWLLETERGLSSPLTPGAVRNVMPLWSPNSQTVLYSRFVGPASSLLRKEANGIGEEQVVIKSETFPSDWSDDGRWVLYQAGAPDTKMDIWILPMTPDRKLPEGAQPKPYLRTHSNETNGRFFPGPNPRWVAFGSDASGRPEVYIDAFPQPRGKTQISTAGGGNPQWGAGGRELFYVSPDNKLMTVSLKLRADSVEPSVPRELFLLPPPVFGRASWYEATRDGQRFLALTGQEQATQTLTVIVNWPALLKKGATAP